MFGAVKVTGLKEKSKKEKKSKHKHHHRHHRGRSDDEGSGSERESSEPAEVRDSQSSRAEEPPAVAKRDEWMTGSGDPSSDRLAAMFEMGKMAVPRMERKAAEKRAERERLMKESEARMNKIDLANDEGIAERAHISERKQEADPWALPESCLVNSGGRKWQARAARRRREGVSDSSTPSEGSSREARDRRREHGARGEDRGERRRGWGRRSRSRSNERRRSDRSSRDELTSLANKYHSREHDRSSEEKKTKPVHEEVDTNALDANELSAAAMRAMLAGDMAEYERLNSLMATKTVVVDQSRDQGALGSAKQSRSKMLSARGDKDEENMGVSELLRQERASRGVRSGEYDRHMAENIRKNKRFKGDAEEDEYFGATEVGGGGENPEVSIPAELTKEKKRRYRGTGWVSEDKRRKEEREERRASRKTQKECDLCMESSSWSRNREDKLIAVSPRVYICMANYKSMLLRGQMILVPQNHCASLRTADEETAEEIRNYQKCLAHFYATMEPPCVPVFIETVKSPPQNDDVMALLGGGAHTTMQCFPVPQDRMKELESYFRQGMSLAGDTWSNQPKIVECKGRSDVSSSGIPPSSPYMHVDFGLQVGIVHIIDKPKEFRWDYGLQTIAGMLEIDKLSLVHYDQPGNGGQQRYDEDLKAFKEAFKAYDWAKNISEALVASGTGLWRLAMVRFGTAVASSSLEVPTHHHPDMYRDDMIINLYAIHRQEMPNVMVSERSQLNRGQFHTTISWTFGNTLETLTADGVDRSKKGSKKDAVRKLMRTLPRHDKSLGVMWRQMSGTLARLLGVKQTMSHNADPRTGLATCFIEWKDAEEPSKSWIGRGSGGTKDEAEVNALRDVYISAAPYREEAAVAQVQRRHEMQKAEAARMASDLEAAASIGTASMLSQKQAAEIMVAHNYMTQRLFHNPSVKLRSNLVVVPHELGYLATCEWSWYSREDDPGNPRKKSATTNGIAANQRVAKAEACRLMLEKYGALQPISAEQWRLADTINGLVVSCNIDQAVQKAVEAIRDTPTHVWTLFLLNVWRALLANGDSAMVENLLLELDSRTRTAGVPVYLWEAMVDECSNLTDFVYSTAVLQRFLKSAKCEVWNEHSLTWAKWRGLLASERIGVIRRALTERQELGIRPVKATMKSCVLPIVQIDLATDLAAEHDMGTDSMAVLFPADGEFRLDSSSESVAVLGVVTSSKKDIETGMTTVTLKLASKEAEYDARLGGNNLMGSEEINCLFLDDTNVTYARMCDALRALYDTPKCDDAMFVNTGVGIAQGTEPGRQPYYFDPAMKAALLGSGAVEPQSLDDGPTDLGMPLTDAQLTAIRGAWNTPVTLIQGPPGTGKTYTAVALVKHWVANKIKANGEGKILVVADSNAAADNIRALMVKAGIECYRVGRAQETDGGTREVGDDVLRKLEGTRAVRDYRRALILGDVHKLPYFRQRIDKAAVEEYQVLVATCIGSGHQLLDSVDFESVVIDECTQATEPASLVPLARGAKRCVLLGDHKQLPAAVHCNAAKSGGLGISLFERLATRGTEVHLLDVQRRMHPSIAEFSNKHFYENKIKHEVSDRPLIPGLHWPNPEIRVALVDTSELSAEETKVGTSLMNREEARLLLDALHSAVSHGTMPHHIGLVVPYNAQKSYVLSALRDDARFTPEQRAAVQINTVDGFQGHEKELIFFSAVRSNEAGQVGFTADPRRMNVMLTRARRGLVVFCDVNTMTASGGHWANWVDWVQQKGGLVSASDWKFNTEALKNSRDQSTTTSLNRESPPRPPPPH
ncbi:hypothetical protein FOL47_004703 [Perkinsus chesapeaki]|uniref:Helicase ATP-binding domain-containing protein n=1 Tax=Perkinsus chesapeaki TaxID=330153 RepID=A0A7J6M102_PERCH|nr:hypothetical protein FOL47_004703 [Perkinsus chesapeaki]